MIKMYDLQGERPEIKGIVPVRITFVSYEGGQIDQKGTVTCSNHEECEFEHVGIYEPFFDNPGSLLVKHSLSGLQSPVKDLRSLVSNSCDQIRPNHSLEW